MQPKYSNKYGNHTLTCWFPNFNSLVAWSAKNKQTALCQISIYTCTCDCNEWTIYHNLCFYQYKLVKKALLVWLCISVLKVGVVMIVSCGGPRLWWLLLFLGQPQQSNQLSGTCRRGLSDESMEALLVFSESHPLRKNYNYSDSIVLILFSHQ